MINSALQNTFERTISRVDFLLEWSMIADMFS